MSLIQIVNLKSLGDDRGGLVALENNKNIMTGCRHLAKSISKIKPISHTVELRILSFYLKKDKGGQNLERRIIKITYKNV